MGVLDPGVARGPRGCPSSASRQRGRRRPRRTIRRYPGSPVLVPASVAPPDPGRWRSRMCRVPWRSRRIRRVGVLGRGVRGVATAPGDGDPGDLPRRLGPLAIVRSEPSGRTPGERRRTAVGDQQPLTADGQVVRLVLLRRMILVDGAPALVSADAGLGVTTSADAASAAMAYFVAFTASPLVEVRGTSWADRPPSSTGASPCALRASLVSPAFQLPRRPRGRRIALT